MGFLNNKRILITGLASDRSIAKGLADAMRREGAELVLSYQNERLRGRVEKMAEGLGAAACIPCDVETDEGIDRAFEALDSVWDGLDGLVHSIAYAPRDHLDGGYLDNLSREGFRIAHEISSYSFSALAMRARSRMIGRQGAMLSLSYIGSTRAMPSYNIMGLAKASLEANVRYMAAALGADGIRVNAVSAGPVRTLAASGIKGFKEFMRRMEDAAPLGRNVSIEEIGNVGAFLCSDLASGITGEITYVDSGYHAVMG